MDQPWRPHRPRSPAPTPPPDTLEDVVPGRRAARRHADARRPRRRGEPSSASPPRSSSARPPPRQPSSALGYRPTTTSRGAERGLRGDPEQRMAQLHARSARAVAPLIRAQRRGGARLPARADELLVISRRSLGVNPRETRYFAEEYLPALRAMDTQTAAEGQEFVPRELLGVADRARQPRPHGRRAVPLDPMPTNPFDIPGRGVGRSAPARSPRTPPTPARPKASRRSPRHAQGHADRGEVRRRGAGLQGGRGGRDHRDAAVHQEELVDYLGADIEDAIVNGDTTGTHQDSDVTASDDPRKNWNGLRKLAPPAPRPTASNAALTVAHLRTNRKKMGKYGVRRATSRTSCRSTAYIQLLSDPSVHHDREVRPERDDPHRASSARSTACRSSCRVRPHDLNATGVNDGTTTNRTSRAHGPPPRLRHRRAPRHDRPGPARALRRGRPGRRPGHARKAFSARFPTTEPIVAEHLQPQAAQVAADFPEFFEVDAAAPAPKPAAKPRTAAKPKA
jgi:hypothetical protein